MIAEEPTTYEEAMDSPDYDKWQLAIMEKHQSIVDAGVWEVADLPKGKKPIKSRWLFQIKLNADGSIERYKARLVAKGYSQQYGIDYDETYAPVSRYDSLRYLIAIVGQLNLLLEQLDIKTAFLNGKLDKEIWVQPPPGIGLEGKYLRLRKALYGLKQAPLKWYEKFTSVLISLGYQPLQFDPCMFAYNPANPTANPTVNPTSNPTKNLAIVVIYIDDITVTGSRQEIDRLTAGLKDNFQVSVKGSLNWLLGIEIIQGRESITLNQKGYAERIMKKFGYEDLKPVATSLDTSVKLLKATEDEAAIDITDY